MPTFDLAAPTPVFMPCLARALATGEATGTFTLAVALSVSSPPLASDRGHALRESQ